MYVQTNVSASKGQKGASDLHRVTGHGETPGTVDAGN